MASVRACLLLVVTACAVDGDGGLSPDDGFDDTVDDGKADASNASAAVVHRFEVDTRALR